MLLVQAMLKPILLILGLVAVGAFAQAQIPELPIKYTASFSFVRFHPSLWLVLLIVFPL